MPTHYSIPPIPSDTARAAHAVYSRSNIYLSIGNQLTDLTIDFHKYNSPHMEVHPHFKVPFLALVTFLQYLEKLTDRQAEEATSARIDWKYALHLSMNYPGLNPTVLCVYRQRLLSHISSQREFQHFLERMKEAGFIKVKPEQPLDALYVLTEVCVRTRLDRAMTGMQHALQSLAIRHPEWLRNISLPHWYRRYDATNRQLDLTQSVEQQRALIEAIGRDVTFLLEAIDQTGSPELTSLNEIQQLRQLWREQFDPIDPEPISLLPFCRLCGTL